MCVYTHVLDRIMYIVYICISVCLNDFPVDGCFYPAPASLPGTWAV